MELSSQGIVVAKLLKHLRIGLQQVTVCPWVIELQCTFQWIL